MSETTTHETTTWRRQYAELQADNGRLLGRIKSLENDLEHALASVGAFRAAIEDVWAKSAGESGEDGFIVSYVIPVGVLHRAIGLARGTDVGGKLLAERDESVANMTATAAAFARLKANSEAWNDDSHRLHNEYMPTAAIMDEVLATRDRAITEAWAERDALRARAGRAVELCDDTFQPMWFESVPSGVRWFCGECQGVVSGFSETEQAEADAAMPHQQTCRWVFAGRIRAALAASGGEAS